MASLLPATQSPLFFAVDIDGRTYFTSQYFHRWYCEQKALEGHEGKYRRHDNFRAKIRSMELYGRLITGKHILVLTWDEVKNGPTEILSRLRTLFKSTGYYDLILLDATAQLELTHHLDDELSKEIAYRHSNATAQQPHAVGDILPTEYATRELNAFLRAGQLLKTPEHIAQQEAVKYVEASTGVSFRHLLLSAPAQDAIPDHDIMLEPTELAHRLGYASAIALNKALAAHGWQQRHMGSWEARGEGTKHSTRHAWINGGKTGYNLKWNYQAVEMLLAGASA